MDLAETLPTALGYESYGDRYAHNWKPTRNLPTRLLGDPAVAEDLAADVLVRVWARWQAGGVPRWPSAYLAQATRNAVASEIRRGVRDRRTLRSRLLRARRRLPEAQ